MAAARCDVEPQQNVFASSELLQPRPRPIIHSVSRPSRPRCSILSRLRWQLTFPTRRVAVG
eukprot:6214848-Prymnesium_polylepis.1